MEEYIQILAIIIYIIIGIFAVYCYNKKIKKIEKPSYSGIIFSMILYYIVIPIILLLFTDDFVEYENECGMWCNDSINKHILNKNLFEVLYSALCVGISFFFFNYSYKKNRNKYICTKKNEKILRIFKLVNRITLIIGGICLILFIASVGGVAEMIKKAEYYRSFSNSLVDDIGNFAILIVPARLVTVTPILSLFLIDNDKKNKKEYILELIISFVMAAFFYLYNAGRAPIILFGLSLFYVFLKKYIKKPWTIIIILTVIGLPLLDVIDSLFSGLLIGGELKVSFNYVKYLYQFIYPYRNILNMRNINIEFGYRYFLDYITSFIDILPKVSFAASYENTSLYINGTNWKVIGGIPNDFITFSNLQLGIIGNIIISYFLGFISSILDMKAANLKPGFGKNLILAILTLYTYSLIISFDFCTFIRGNLILIIVGMLILLSCKIERKKVG